MLHKPLLQCANVKRLKKLEQERIKMAETNRRKAMLSKLSFVFHDLTRTMNWVQDETLLIPLA